MGFIILISMEAKTRNRLSNNIWGFEIHNYFSQMFVTTSQIYKKKKKKIPVYSIVNGCGFI